MDVPGSKGVTLRVLIGRREEASRFALRILEVTPGGYTPRHAHNYEHEVLVLEGTGQVLGGVDAATIRPIRAGDALFIPPNETHQFRNVGTQTLRFACIVPVMFECGSSQSRSTPDT